MTEQDIQARIDRLTSDINLLTRDRIDAKAVVDDIDLQLKVAKLSGEVDVEWLKSATTVRNLKARRASSLLHELTVAQASMAKLEQDLRAAKHSVLCSKVRLRTRSFHLAFLESAKLYLDPETFETIAEIARVELELV